MACLDTTVLLDLMGRSGDRLRLRAIDFLGRLAAQGEPLVTSRFTQAELFVGIERSSDPAKEEARVVAVLEPLGLLEFDERSARLFGRFTAALAKRGRPIGDMDVLIAAVAVANGQPVVTRNVTHFESIPEVEVLTY